MRKIDFFEIKQRLNLEYTNKQVISCASINIKKDNINQEIIRKHNQIIERGIFKNRENEGIYLDVNYNSNSFALQPCIVSRNKTFRLPIFELTYEIQFPSITYQVKQNSRLYEEIYSAIYSKYSNIENSFVEISRKIRVSEMNSVFESSKLEEQLYSLYWDGENLFSNSSLILGEVTGILYNSTDSDNNHFSFELPNISTKEMNVTLDFSQYCNEFAFLKHCRLPYPFDKEFMKPNTQLQWLYIDQWPHLVVLTIPGVEIKQGDELIVDFGEEYHEKYLQNYKKLFKNLLNLRVNDLQLVYLCKVCNSEMNLDFQEVKKCAFCRSYLHDECGYHFDAKKNSICCLNCLRNSFDMIFSIYKRKGDYFLHKKINNLDLYDETMGHILKILSNEYKACNECLKVFSRSNNEIERQKSSFICKLIHGFNQTIEKNTDNIDSFYAEFNSKSDSQLKNINLNIKVLENFYFIFDLLIQHIKEIWENNKTIQSFDLHMDLSKDNYIDFSNESSKNLFPDSVIYETWRNSKWRDFICWDNVKSCWVGVLKPNGLKLDFNCSTKHPTIIDCFYKAEKWVEKRLNETIIPNNLLKAILSYKNCKISYEEKSDIQETNLNLTQPTYHSPYLPTDLASHPDYKIIFSDYENGKYSFNTAGMTSCQNSCSVNDSQISTTNNKTIENQINQNVSNTDLQTFSYTNISDFIINDDRSQIISSASYIQCCSPVNRKRRIRSTLPLTSNAAKCPTEWRVRGITWHAERKAFIVPYRRDKDGGLTSTTFGAMKYGSPLTAFLKALEFRENYLKEQSTKLPDEIKQPNVICDQALLIRNLPNIVWDSSKLVWRALAEQDLLCDDNQTQKLNIGSHDVEVNAIPYGARIAYEIAEVCYIRRKALLLNSKESSLTQKSTGVGSRSRYKTGSVEQLGFEYNSIIDEENNYMNKNPHVTSIASQNSFKKIRLKIILPSGEEVIRGDLIGWHFRTNSWIVTKIPVENESNNKLIKINQTSQIVLKQKSTIHSLISAIEYCSGIPPKCQVFIHAEEAESIIEPEDLAELLKPFPTGISWYSKKRRFYTSNGLDSNGRGQHFSIALYGSLIAAFNAAIDYRNIFLKNRRKNILPKIEWILCYPINLNAINIYGNERTKDVISKSSNEEIKKNASNFREYNLTNNYLNDCNERNIDRIGNHITTINNCISADNYHSEGVWLQHPTTVSLLDDQLIDAQGDLNGQILNIDMLE